MSDDVLCQKCKSYMERKGTLANPPNWVNSVLYQCPECKNVELLPEDKKSG